jgi:hypothetical protein
MADVDINSEELLNQRVWFKTNEVITIRGQKPSSNKKAATARWQMLVFFPNRDLDDRFLFWMSVWAFPQPVLKF